MQPPGPPTFQPATSLKKPRAPILAGLFGLLFIVALVFGVWAYNGRTTYKNNANTQASTAATHAAAAQKTADQADFAQQLKQPYASFTGPNTYGLIKFSYPKTWSAYVDETSSSEPINAYYYPSAVPGISGNTAYALRVELTGSNYSDVLNQFQSQIQQGSLTASAYVPAKLAKNTAVQRGTKLVGQLSDTTNGAMIIIPVRDQTLQIYTQSKDYLSDFNNIVLPSLTFSP